MNENRWRQRLENFAKALEQLNAACKQEAYSDLERAGLVQMFEFSFELAWKTMKDLLNVEGFDVNTPRDAIRKAFVGGLVIEDDAEILLDALEKRNLLTHTYDEATAHEAEQLIKEQYAPALLRLLARLESKENG
ncbi:nucleotidyltransferase substrate binding protein [bacterium]|nr:nucleotidyltransferase substrate binding protein [bacterium]